MQRSKAGLKVDIPKEGEPVRLGRVGLIAVVGFAVGVAWPHVAGVRLVPALPGRAEPAAREASEEAPDEAPSPIAPSAAVPPPASAEAQETPAGHPPVVGEGVISSCGDGSGKKKTCDSIDFDRVARPRIAALEDCELAGRVSGVLSLGFELDFASERVTRVTSGKSTSLGDAETEALLECYRKSFEKASLAGIAHEHSRYSIYYRVELKGEGSEGASPGAEPTVTPASGTATVAWNTALIRTAPERNAKVVARVLQGTRVGVTGRSDDWYRVKYDAKGNQGWVFRTAIGM